LVYVAASADGYVVGEELEGAYFEDGEQEFVGDGDVGDAGFRIIRGIVFIICPMCSSPSMAMATGGPYLIASPLQRDLPQIKHPETLPIGYSQPPPSLLLDVKVADHRHGEIPL